VASGSKICQALPLGCVQPARSRAADAAAGVMRSGRVTPQS